MVAVTHFSTLDELEEEDSNQSNTANNNHQTNLPLSSRRQPSLSITASSPSSTTIPNEGNWAIEGVRPNDETTTINTNNTLMNENDEIEVSLMSTPIESNSPSHHGNYSTRRASVVSSTPVINTIVNNTQSVLSNSSGGISTNLNNAMVNTINVPMTTFSVETNPGSIFNVASETSTDVPQAMKKPNLKDISKADKEHRQSFYIYHYEYKPSSSDNGKTVNTSIRNIKKKNQENETQVNDSAFKSFFIKTGQSLEKEKIESMKKSVNSLKASKNGIESEMQKGMPNVNSSTSSSLPKQQENLPFLISLKLTFAILISILIVFVCVGIFVSVFAPLYVSIEELTNKNVQTIHKQITVHLDKILGSLKSASLLGADNYNSGFITRPLFREYLLSAYRRTGVFVGYFFSNPPMSERFSYTIMSPGNRLFYTRQENGFPGIIRDRVDINGTVIQYNATVDFTPAVLTRTDFYVNSLANIARLKTEGVFSPPFFIINGSIALPFATLLYDPIVFKENGTKIIQGLVRSTIPLILFSDFLKEIKVLENGYTILTEMNGPLTIAGSIKTTSEDGRRSLSVFDLTEKNAGILMKKINSTYNFYSPPSFFSISSEGVSYIVSISNYTNENIAWRQFVIVYSEDITKTVQNSIIASICVAFGILLFSVLYGILISRIAIRPILFLEKQLALIQVFDLKNVKKTQSIFVEINSIYNSLASTVKCLTEIKSFLPDTVVKQLDEIEKSERQLVEVNTRKSTVVNNPVSLEKSSLENKSTRSITKSSHSNLSSFRLSSSQTKGIVNNNTLFKMGLSKKECSVLNITLPQYSVLHTPDDISTTFPKIVTIIKNAANQFQANLQVVSISEFILVFDTGKQRKHIAVTAMECSLKIKRGLQALNTQYDMSSEKVEPFTFSMGVSTNENSYVGNIGTKTFRYYSIISESTVIAKNLSFLANQLKVNIVVDETTFKESSKYFITRPIERVLFRSIKKHIIDNDAEYLKSQITTLDSVNNVYELIRESAIEENEWMYELQNQNENLRIQKYHAIFDIFKPEISNENFLELLSEKILELKQYMITDPNDFPSKNLLELYEKFEANKTANIQSFRNTVSTYCISIDKAINTHLLLGVDSNK